MRQNEGKEPVLNECTAKASDLDGDHREGSSEEAMLKQIQRISGGKLSKELGEDVWRLGQERARQA